MDGEETAPMRERLLRTYWAMAGSAGLLFAVLWTLGRLGLAAPPAALAGRPWIARAIFVASALAGIAAPLALRTMFVSRNRTSGAIPEAELERFERAVLRVALVAPFLAVAAAWIEAPRVFLAGSALSAFYALYYLYPSERRIRHERRIFRAR